MKIHYRYSLTKEDREQIKTILIDTQFFSSDEVDIALELVDDSFLKNEASDYRFLIASDHKKLLGYACYGKIPGTDGCYDLYWIAVNPSMQGKNIGSEILKKVEAIVTQFKGRKIYIETAGRDCYIKTRKFYEKNNYLVEAILKDFYSMGDSKYIYSKDMDLLAL